MQDVSFSVDTKLRRGMVKRARAESTLNKVFWVLFVVAGLWLIASVPFFQNALPDGGEAGRTPNPNDIPTMLPLIRAMMAMLFGGIPFVSMFMIRRAKVDTKVYYKGGEELTLRSEFLENTYLYLYTSPTTRRWMIYFPYAGINRLELCSERGVLKVYGDYEIRWSFMPRPGFDTFKRAYKQPLARHQIFYLYYEQSQAFVDALSERSGIPVTLVDADAMVLDEERS